MIVARHSSRLTFVVAVATAGVALALTGCGATSSATGRVTAPSSSAVSSSAVPSSPVASPPFAAPVIPPAELAQALDELSAYDASAPLAEHVVTPTEETPRGVRVTGIAWASPGGGEVPAWLVEPPATLPGPYAGLVYVHGSETSNNDLRDEAEAMATSGAVSLVIGAPFARPSRSVKPYLESYEEPELERDMTAQAIIDVRRAYDLLTSRTDVDPARLGFVGHSWGASLGADIAAVDTRVAAVAMLAPRPSWTGFLASDDVFATTRRRVVGDEIFTRYLTIMAPFDALPQIGRAPGERLLLQYGRADDVVPPDVAQQLVDAAPTGTTTQWFDGAGHALDAAAVEARCAWLGERLGLLPVAADVLAEVGLPDQ